MSFINETLEAYANEGRTLYKRLFLKQCPLNNVDDANNYLRDHSRYTFIAKMFDGMQLYHWRDEVKFLEDLEK